MPGRQTVRWGGLELRVRPQFWLRRVIPFPFFFESHNPSFVLDAVRVADSPRSDDPLRDRSIMLEFKFADQTISVEHVLLPELKIGEKASVPTGQIFTAFPGQTIIRIPLDKVGQTGVWQTIYSYRVRTEEQLWLAIVGPVGALLLTVLAQITARWVSSSWLGMP